MKIVVDIKGLEKSFSSRPHITAPLHHIRALTGVDMSLHEGEIFSLLGPNGSGKTTLIRILSGLVTRDRGELKLFGWDPDTHSHKTTPLLGLLLADERSFYWRLTGMQNLEFFAVLYNICGELRRKRIEEIRSLLEFEDLDKPFQTYSTGNKQKLALARALLNEAPLLVMDEPTRSLDPGASIHFLKTVQSIIHKTKKTLLFTTHRLEEAECFADRIGILDQGRIKACGTMNELRRQSDGALHLGQIFSKVTGQTT